MIQQMLAAALLLSLLGSLALLVWVLLEEALKSRPKFRLGTLLGFVTVACFALAVLPEWRLAAAATAFLWAVLWVGYAVTAALLDLKRNARPDLAKYSDRRRGRRWWLRRWTNRYVAGGMGRRHDFESDYTSLTGATDEPEQDEV